MTLLLTKNSALCCFIYYIDFSHNFIFLILHLKTEHQTLPSKISSLMKEMWNSHKLLDFPTFSRGKIAFTSNATYILLYLTSRSTVALVKQAIGPHGFWNHELCLFGASLLVLILVTREFHELFAHKKFYFMNRENYIQLALMTSMMGFIISSVIDLDYTQHFGAWMVFFSWVDLTLLFGKMDRVGECVYMSIDVLKTMALCLIIYVPSYLAFSFGFYILLHSI